MCLYAYVCLCAHMHMCAYMSERVAAYISMLMIQFCASENIGVLSFCSYA